MSHANLVDIIGINKPLPYDLITIIEIRLKCGTRS